MTVKLHADIKWQTASQDIFMSQLLWINSEMKALAVNTWSVGDWIVATNPLLQN